jgi:tetratricopeptide (TPR) repeat protein
VPTFIPTTDDSAEERPKFITGSRLDYVANFFNASRDLETHCRVARSMAFIYELDYAIPEYRKAAQKLTDSNSGTQVPILKSTLLELASVYCCNTSTCHMVLDLLNEYLALDQSNYKAYSRLGVALWRCDRNSEAIEAMAKALALEPTDPDTVRQLVDLMMSENRYSDIITLLETEEPRTSCLRIQGNIDVPKFHNSIFYAGLVTGKLKLVTEIYQSTIAQIGIGTMQLSHRDIMYTPESAGVLARRWLALLYQRYTGEPDRAFHLYVDALLHSAAFWKLGQWHSGMDFEIIPSACDDFAELIYEMASPLTHDENDVNDNKLLTMIKILERLRTRQAASEANTAYEHWKIYSQKNINVILSKLYLRCGRNAEADFLLREQAQRGIDLLQDDIYWNDGYGFQTLSKVLIAYGREDDAKISLGLRQVTDKDFGFGFADDISENDTSKEEEGDDAGNAPEHIGASVPDQVSCPQLESGRLVPNHANRPTRRRF